MIQLIQDVPNGVVGVEASGTVTGADYESVLIPAVLEATEGGKKARFLLVFGDGFEGYDAQAAKDDAQLGAHHWSDFERIAFVSDHSVYRSMIKGFGFLMPGELKVYPLADLETAKNWLGS